jgi:hypothetical protein
MLEPGSDIDNIEENINHELFQCENDERQQSLFSQTMEEHFNSAELRTKCARAWLIELPEHVYTADLRKQLCSFIATLIEHETHLEAHKDVVPNIGDWRYRSQHLFAAQLSAVCIGPQWKAMKDEVDTVMGRNKMCQEEGDEEGGEEGGEEEAPEDDPEVSSSTSSSSESSTSSVMRLSDEDVDSSAPENRAQRTARKKLEATAGDSGDENAATGRRSARLASAKARGHEKKKGEKGTQDNSAKKGGKGTEKKKAKGGGKKKDNKATKGGKAKGKSKGKKKGPVTKAWISPPPKRRCRSLEKWSPPPSGNLGAVSKASAPSAPSGAASRGAKRPPAMSLVNPFGQGPQAPGSPSLQQFYAEQAAAEAVTAAAEPPIAVADSPDAPVKKRRRRGKEVASAEASKSHFGDAD